MQRAAQGNCLQRAPFDSDAPYDSDAYVGKLTGCPTVNGYFDRRAVVKGLGDVEKTPDGKLVYKRGNNEAYKFPFVERGTLVILQKYLFGSALIRCFEVSPAWFVLFLRGMDDICASIDEGFRQAYPEMVLESGRSIFDASSIIATRYISKNQFHAVMCVSVVTNQKGLPSSKTDFHILPSAI